MIERDFPVALAITRIDHDQIDFAVEEMNTDIAPGDHFANIPFTVRFFIFHRRRYAVAGRNRYKGKARLINVALLAVGFSAVRHPRRAIQDEFDRLGVAIDAGDTPPLADAFLHDVALDRPHPGGATG